MFDFLKRKEECTEMVQQPEENLLREYISVDSVKAHLVDILEENRKLKARFHSPSSDKSPYWIQLPIHQYNITEKARFKFSPQRNVQTFRLIP